MRMVKAEKRKMTWMGMILQTIWRFGMLSARIVALVLLTLALKEWVIIVLCKSLPPFQLPEFGVLIFTLNMFLLYLKSLIGSL